MARERDAFELKLTDGQRTLLQNELVDQIQKGIDARTVSEQEVDYWWQLYEQARTRSQNSPWPDAADLTSYLASEKVDALQARLLRAIWTDPVWSVEGWGEAADRAPFVEEFHQWKVEEERLQAVLDRWSLMALIEPRGLLEISEGTEVRPVRRRITAKIKVDPATGGPIYGEDLRPVLDQDPAGKYLEANDQDLGVDTVVDEYERVRTGPVYRVLPYRDSLILPGHARDREDIWGYGKRFWRRQSDLMRMAEAGVYDKAAIERLGTEERQPDPALERSNQAIAPQDGSQAENELWELLVLLDLDQLFKEHRESRLHGRAFNGPRWYLATLHLGTNQLLRFQHDDFERSRFVMVNLFPRSDRATEGYSFVGHKLITVIEEHTAWRNMAADRAALEVSMPIKRLTGALWDPYDQPIGPKSVIDVRDMNEVQAMDVPRTSNSALQHIQMSEKIAERIAGVNDIAAGQVNMESRTLGEVRMATANSEIRMDAIIRRFQEAMEDIGQIRHAIWKRTLADQQQGMELPQSVILNLEGRGASIDGFLPDQKITAQLLAGAFRFKPRGSVETADPNAMRQDWMQFLQALPAVLQTFPMAAAMFQTPQAARAFVRQMLRVFRVENTQAILGSPAQDLMGQGGMPGMMPGPMMPPGMGMPGQLPPGMPVPPDFLQQQPPMSSSVVQ